MPSELFQINSEIRAATFRSSALLWQTRYRLQQTIANSLDIIALSQKLIAEVDDTFALARVRRRIHDVGGRGFLRTCFTAA